MHLCSQLETFPLLLLPCTNPQQLAHLCASFINRRSLLKLRQRRFPYRERAPESEKEGLPSFFPPVMQTKFARCSRSWL